MNFARSTSPHGVLAALLVLTIGAGGCSKGDQASSATEASGSTAAAASLPPAAGAAPAAGVAPAPQASAAVPSSPVGAAPAAAEGPLDPAQIPELVARFDGSEITRADLISRANEARGALAQRGVGVPVANRTFYRKVVDDILGNRILYRDLAKQGKAATPAEVEQQVAAIRGQFKSDEEFDRSLAERGFDRERLKRDVGEGITVSRWVMGTVATSITISEEEARRFFDANKEKMVQPERAHARHVLVLIDAKASAEERAVRRKRAEEARARIAGGADFATVAREISDDKGSAERGGDLGWFPRGQMVPAFDRAAFELAPGKLSELIETRFGLHVLEVIERQPASPITFEQARPRIEEVVRQRRLEETVRARINELAKDAKVEIYL